MITIKDIAKQANVSVATVSRVMNNDSKVSAVTRQRVLDVINKFDYVPNVTGRNLRVNKTKKLLIIISKLCDNKYEQLISSIMKTAEIFGYSVFFAVTNNVIDNEFKYIKTLKNKSFDGIFSLGTMLNKDDLYNIKQTFSAFISCSKNENFNVNQVFDILEFENHNKPVIRNSSDDVDIYFIKI